MKALIFDTETTGLLKHPSAKPSVQPRVIEFGGLLVDVATGEELARLSLLINPGTKLDAVITRITGLTDEDLKDAPPFSAAQRDILPLFEAADVMIAHNLPFDVGVIEMDLARCGVVWGRWPRWQLCTVQEHAESWGKFPKLTALYEAVIGEPLAQSHRAIEDVEALWRVCVETKLLENLP